MALAVDMRAPLPPEALQVNRRRPRSFCLLIFPLHGTSCSVISFVAAREEIFAKHSRVFLFDLYRSKFRGRAVVNLSADTTNSLFFFPRRNCSPFYEFLIGKDTISQWNTRGNKDEESTVSEKVVTSSRRGISSLL